LGDLLMQIVMHCLIAAENGDFKLEDVVRSACTKLIRRHPHVFGAIKMKDTAEVLLNWETLKKAERADDTSMLASVPEYMPALAYSEEVQTRVARVGFDWTDINGVIDKLIEEVAEFRHAESLEQREIEFGDLLFTLTNFARRLGIDSEAALRRANKRFYQRFSTMEKICRRRGVDFSMLSFDEQNTLWEEAKRAR
jgi:tetrapyrrole methylase family protein/MazG family protein